MIHFSIIYIFNINSNIFIISFCYYLLFICILCHRFFLFFFQFPLRGLRRERARYFGLTKPPKDSVGEWWRLWGVFNEPKHSIWRLKILVRIFYNKTAYVTSARLHTKTNLLIIKYILETLLFERLKGGNISWYIYLEIR